MKSETANTCVNSVYVIWKGLRESKQKTHSKSQFSSAVKPFAQHSTRYLVNHLWLMWIRVRQAGPVKMWCQPQPQPHSFSHPNQALFSTSDPIFTEAADQASASHEAATDSAYLPYFYQLEDAICHRSAVQWVLIKFWRTCLIIARNCKNSTNHQVNRPQCHVTGYRSDLFSMGFLLFDICLAASAYRQCAACSKTGFHSHSIKSKLN